MLGRVGAASNFHQGKTHIEKLCMDVAQDRLRYHEIANDPNCEIDEKNFNSTPKGVVWMTLIYNRRGPEPEKTVETLLEMVDRQTKEEDEPEQE